MPRKVFTAGEVLAAADVNTFLMDQSVMTFTDSTARESAIGSAVAVEGMLTYLDDTNAFEYWNGTAFESIVPAPAGAGGLTHIQTSTAGTVASLTLNDVFSSTYDNYKIIIRCVVGSNASMRMRLRVGGVDATGNNYFMAFEGIDTSGNGVSVTANAQSSYQLTQQVAASPTELRFVADFFDPFIATGTRVSGFSYNDQNGSQMAGGVSHTAANSYDGFTLFPSTGNFNSITATVYGYEK